MRSPVDRRHCNSPPDTRSSDVSEDGDDGGIGNREGEKNSSSFEPLELEGLEFDSLALRERFDDRGGHEKAPPDGPARRDQHVALDPPSRSGSSSSAAMSTAELSAASMEPEPAPSPVAGVLGVVGSARNREPDYVDIEVPKHIDSYIEGVPTGNDFDSFVEGGTTGNENDTTEHDGRCGITSSNSNYATTTNPSIVPSKQHHLHPLAPMAIIAPSPIDSVMKNQAAVAMDPAERTAAAHEAAAAGKAVGVVSVEDGPQTSLTSSEEEELAEEASPVAETKAEEEERLRRAPLIKNHEHSDSLVTVSSFASPTSSLRLDGNMKTIAAEEEAATENGPQTPLLTGDHSSSSLPLADTGGGSRVSLSVDPPAPKALLGASILAFSLNEEELEDDEEPVNGGSLSTDEIKLTVSGEERAALIATLSPVREGDDFGDFQRQPSGSYTSEEEPEEEHRGTSPTTPITAETPSRRTPSPVNGDQQKQQHHQQQHHRTSQQQRQSHHQEQLSPPSPRTASAVPRSPSRITYTSSSQLHPGRRSITLRLLEEVAATPHSISSPLIKGFVKGSEKVATPFRSLRRFRNMSSPAPMGGGSGGGRGESPQPSERILDRGAVTVSWYEGTTSVEMTEHVFNCVLRRLNGIQDIKGRLGAGGEIKLEDVRLLDESLTPHGEVVLCPFLPDGSYFVLKFKIAVEPPVQQPPKINHRFPKLYSGPTYVSRAPDSPSAEPSPHPSNIDLLSLDALDDGNVIRSKTLKAQQTRELMGAVAELLKQQQAGRQLDANAAAAAAAAAAIADSNEPPPPLNLNGGVPKLPTLSEKGKMEPRSVSFREEKKEDITPNEQQSILKTPSNGVSSTPKKGAGGGGGGGMPVMEPVPENSTTDDLIEQQLQQLNKLFNRRRTIGGGVVPDTDAMSSTANNGVNDESDDDPYARAYRRQEKKQVIFVISNYLVLFMSLIALSAEIQSRLPGWMDWVQKNYDSVQNCATDRDALIECLSDGDFSGLVASFLLWATQSAAAKRIFLFGFDTPKKLWIVVYEALVTAACWGMSYLFIRRGLNPNTRQNFLHKYWKDAVYGSLAGFNAAFMKAVLKNLIPQDVALEALEGRQLRIFRWLGSMMADEVIE